MRDGLQAFLLHRTRYYNLKTQKPNGLTISEWAAVLTTAPAAISRVLTQEVHLPLPAHVFVDLDHVPNLHGMEEVSRGASRRGGFLRVCHFA